MIFVIRLRLKFRLAISPADEVAWSMAPCSLPYEATKVAIGATAVSSSSGQTESWGRGEASSAPLGLCPPSILHDPACSQEKFYCMVHIFHPFCFLRVIFSFLGLCPRSVRPTVLRVLRCRRRLGLNVFDGVALFHKFFGIMLITL